MVEGNLHHATAVLFSNRNILGANMIPVIVQIVHSISLTALSSNISLEEMLQSTYNIAGLAVCRHSGGREITDLEFS